MKSGRMQGRMQGAAMAEGALRALLPETAQHRFQHLMRIVLNEFIIPLNPSAGGRYTIRNIISLPKDFHHIA